MARVVIKFGGTSLGNIEQITKVAHLIKKKKTSNNEIIVVVSAMAGVTNDLIEKSKQISKNYDKAELDVLLTAGEQMSSSLLSAALIDQGCKSRSWQSWQIPIITEGSHNASRIFKVNTDEINNFLKSGGIPVIPGFQGISNLLRLTTIGRGGSDASAVAIAKFFDADLCEIYTDVEGVYTTNPNIHSGAKKIEKISYEEILEMASLGTKIMQASAVQIAMLNNVSIHVRSTFSENEGSKILPDAKLDYNKSVTGISFSKNDAKITLIGVKDRPGVAASIFEPLGKNDINVDMVIQNISPDGKETDVTFTIKRDELNKSIKLMDEIRTKIKYKKLVYDDKVAKVSIIGAGMIVSPGITYKMFKSLADENINIIAISTSEIKISILVNEEKTAEAVKILHKNFKLD